MITVGMDISVPTSEIKYITLINVLSLVGGVFLVSGFSVVFILYLPESSVYLFHSTVCVILFPLVLLFNYFRMYLISRIYFNVLGIVILVTVSIMGGHEMNTHLFLFLVIFAAFFIYPPHEKAFMYGIIYFTLASFLYLEIWFINHEGVLDLSPSFIKAMALNFNIGLIVYVSGFSFYIYKIYFRAEDRLETERRKSEQLLHNILPVKVAERLKINYQTIADGFNDCSVLFADLEGFTSFSQSVSPEGLVQVLNEIFSNFDDLVEKYNMEKIKTIGDSYMAVAGLPEPRNDHADAVAGFAMEILESLRKYHEERGWGLQLRIGIDSGPVVAGVIGKKKFIYDLWGDTVNTASRMESHGLPGEIQVTKNTYDLLKHKYEFVERGYLDIKGKGKMKTYLLKG